MRPIVCLGVIANLTRPRAEEGEDSFVELPEEYIGPGTAETKDGEEK